MNKLIFILVIFLFIHNNIGLFFKKQDRVHSSIGYLRSCGTEEDNRLKLHIATRKFNRTHLATSMNITIYEDFGEEYMIDMELMLWSDGGWKRNFFRYKKKNACDALYTVMGPVWIDIIKTAKAPLGCPLKAGYYEFNDHYLDFTQLPFVSMPGRFLMVAIVTKRKVPQLCVEVEVEFNLVMLGVS